MDWRAVRFDWNQTRAFLVTAEEGSMSAAARALGLSQPTIGRQIAALEAELGVVLFERIGGRVELTAAGLQLLEPARAMGEAALRTSLAATGQASALQGTVVITASELISAHLLPPVVTALRRDHPGIELEIVASNDVRDLLRREADIAVRNVAPTQAELVARKVRDAVARPYATPSWAERLRAGVAAAEFIAFDDPQGMIAYLAGRGTRVRTEQFPLRVANHLVQWELCKQGVGICFVMEEVGDREPAVVRVLPEIGPLPVPIWLTCHREVRTNPRIRVVFDRLAEALARPVGDVAC